MAGTGQSSNEPVALKPDPEGPREPLRVSSAGRVRSDFCSWAYSSHLDCHGHLSGTYLTPSPQGMTPCKIRVAHGPVGKHGDTQGAHTLPFQWGATQVVPPAGTALGLRPHSTTSQPHGWVSVSPVKGGTR